METIGLIEQPLRSTAAVRHVIAMDEVAKHFATAIESVLARLGEAGVAPAGAPFSRYRGDVGRTVDVEIGFPVPDGTDPVADLVMGTLPAGRAVEVTHVGDYESLRDTYAAIESWVGEHRVTLREECWEIYEAGPASDPDPATWRTRIVWPVAEPQIGTAPSQAEEGAHQ